MLVTTLFSIATLADGAAGLAGLCITSAMAFTTSGMSSFLFFSFLEFPQPANGSTVSILGLPLLDRYDPVVFVFLFIA